MLVVKTGISPEYDIARAHFPDAVHLTGVQTLATLEAQVPPTCTAIASFGLCGGLRPQQPIVGQTVVSSTLVTPASVYVPIPPHMPTESYAADAAWCERIYTKTLYGAHPYFSSGRFDTADTPAQRAALYDATQAWCIDDESIYVAQFAAARNIPFAVVRTVSDAWNDDVSITSRILNAGGGVNIAALLWKIAQDLADPNGPEDAFTKIWQHYNASVISLGAAAARLGSDFAGAP